MKLQYRKVNYDKHTGAVVRSTPWEAWQVVDTFFGLDVSDDWDWVEFRKKPPHTAEEIVSFLVNEVHLIRDHGGDDMDLDHLSSVLSGEF